MFRLRTTLPASEAATKVPTICSPLGDKIAPGPRSNLLLGSALALQRDPLRFFVDQAERSHKHESLAYHGHKYKNAAYIPILHGTETGIYETFITSDRTMTDNEVEAELERLILQMRQGPLPPLGASEPDGPAAEGSESLIALNIRRHWQTLEERQAATRR